MCINRVQESTSCQAVRATPSGSGIARRRTAIAANDVAASVPQDGIVDFELCMVKNIKCFEPELKTTLAKHPEILQQCHIEIPPAWVVERIPAGIAKGQSLRSGKGSGVS